MVQRRAGKIAVKVGFTAKMSQGCHAGAQRSIWRRGWILILKPLCT
jgi:hypothetical protein